MPTGSHERASPLFRKRWDSIYLRDLAANEGSFVAEYRVDPRGFEILTELLESSISRDEKYSRRAMSKRRNNVKNDINNYSKG